MIWCIPESDYPTREDWRSEELKYQDDNSFEWRIARVDNGIMVRYFGDPYFKEKMFNCETESGKIVKVNNTNCIFIQDTTFETFYLVRDIIQNGCTDDIWETFEEMFTERFNQDEGMLECERV